MKKQKNLERITQEKLKTIKNLKRFSKMRMGLYMLIGTELVILKN